MLFLPQENPLAISSITPQPPICFVFLTSASSKEYTTGMRKETATKETR